MELLKGKTRIRIEAVRKSKLPAYFWVKAISTACSHLIYLCLFDGVMNYGECSGLLLSLMSQH